MFEQVKAVAFDLDGTIYEGDRVLPGVDSCLSYLEKTGRSVFFITNNSTKSRRQIYERLVHMGIPCRLEQVITSGYVSAQVMRQEGLDKLFIFGSKDLVQEFEEAGISVVGEEEAENLLIGYFPQFTYEDLTAAMNVAMKAKRIIACNKDRNYPGKNGRRMPSCGAMTAPVEWCADRQVDLVVGKPETVILEVLCRENGYRPEEVLVVGDTYTSDNLMAIRGGAPSVYVGTEEHPDVAVVQGVGELPGLFEEK